MKIIVDNKIPYLKGVLDKVAQVIYLPGSAIKKADILSADAMIIRTRTICNKELLDGTTVKFIATATIGFDHIDTQYCNNNFIKWVNAPGSNSSSVQQYVASALISMSRKYHFPLKDKIVGIVGLGNVGLKVANLARLMEMQVLINDPPRERVEGKSSFVSLETICEKADIITFHTPLIKQGIDTTFHLANDSFFEKLKKKVILINTSRGEVVNTSALKKAIINKSLMATVIDVWENEPNIDKQLVDLTDIATPHIAGYSRDGKANATSMVVQQLSRNFHLGVDNWQAVNLEKPQNVVIELKDFTQSCVEMIQQAIYNCYAIDMDDKLLRLHVNDFEKLRENYPVRREYNAYTILIKNDYHFVIKILKDLNFNLIFK